MASISSSVIKTTYLEWDSEFFGCNVGMMSISKASANTLPILLENARSQRYKLLYVFTETLVLITDRILTEFMGRFVDHKVVYEQSIANTNATYLPSIRLFSPDDSVQQLYKLAYQSGEYSRFRVDPAISEASFQQLYRLWVDNSIAGTIADAVFVGQMNELLTSFITIKRKGDTGVIGLIAADAQYRGQGMGTALLDCVKSYAVESGLNRLEVTTQGCNKLACRFYEKNSFTIKSESNTYHFWL